MRRFILDQGISPRTAEILRDRGIPAVHVSDLSLDRSPDSEILVFAALEESVVVTLDRDFPKILALTRARTPSVIFIRIPDLKAMASAVTIERVVSNKREDIEAGASITVDKRGIRSRRLPLH